MKPIEILKELIKFRSLTPSDDGAFNYVSMLLADFSEDRFELNGVTNAIFIKHLGLGPHLCFAGHIDVVRPRRAGYEKWHRSGDLRASGGTRF